MPAIQDILLGDFDMTKESRPIQYVTALALGEYIRTEKLSSEEAKEVSRFMHEVGSIPRIKVWQSLQWGSGVKIASTNIFAVHPYVEKLLVKDASSEAEFREYVSAPHDSSRDSVLRKYGYIL